MRVETFAAAALCFSVSTAAAQSVCTAGETIIWSCKNPKSTYAVCASAGLSAHSGYLQYRATKNGKSVLSFPTTHAHPAGLFTFSLLARGASLSFENAGYRYDLFEGLQGTPSLTVSKADKPLSTIECADSDYTLTLTETINRLRAAGVAD